MIITGKINTPFEGSGLSSLSVTDRNWILMIRHLALAGGLRASGQGRAAIDLESDALGQSFGRQRYRFGERLARVSVPCV